MMKMIRNKKKKGFTLIELIVVVAILGILAAIAIPRLSGMRHSSAVSADGATAKSIVTAARVQETETGVKVANLAGLDADYMDPGKPQTGNNTDFSLSGGGASDYVVTWTSVAPGYAGTQTYTEGDKFLPKVY